MSTGYALSPGTHICRVGDAWVFLDTQRDRYSCLTGAPAKWFSEITRFMHGDHLGQNALALANRLVERGLLTKADRTDGFGEPLPQPRASLQQDEAASAAPICFTELAHFVGVFARSAHVRNPKRRNLVRIIGKARRCKIKARRPLLTAPRKVAGLIHSFNAIAPWFFTEHDACFFRSFLLLRYLARFGVPADWTFAVRLSPFRAHCWVSLDGLILNEDIHVAAGYEPILVL